MQRRHITKVGQLGTAARDFKMNQSEAIKKMREYLEEKITAYRFAKKAIEESGLTLSGKQNGVLTEFLENYNKFNELFGDQK